jgi:hypothetical protein
MIYKGIEFNVAQGIEFGIWKWSVTSGDNEKIGEAKTKPDAVMAAWRAIDQALGRPKQGFTIPRYAAGRTKK